MSDPMSQHSVKTDQGKWRNFFLHLRWIAVLFSFLMWTAYLWERWTGLTWAGKHQIGTISTPASLADAFDGAVSASLPCAVVAVVLHWMVRRLGEQD